jgi:hypothetical protein
MASISSFSWLDNNWFDNKKLSTERIFTNSGTGTALFFILYGHGTAVPLKGRGCRPF